MGGGWTPTRLELRGFGGVGERPLALALDRPLVVLEGPNGSGKSTLVSAIEWALFGELAFPSDLDVSELKGGGSGPRLAYVNRTCPEAEVRVRFERAGSVLEWSRGRRRSDPRRDSVEAVRDGEEVEADPLALLGIDHELYARAVAPRQGSLAALVSLESKERDAALDRLFGIEQLNVLAQGLGKAKGALTKQVSELERRFHDLETGSRREVAWRFDRRAEARKAALAAGLSQADLGLDAARARAERLARELGTTAPAAGATAAELRQLQPHLADAADRAWARPSAQRRLERLQRVEAALTTGPASRLATARTARDAAAAEREAVIARTEPADAIEERLHEAQERLAAVERELTAAGGRERVLVAARDWLARHEQSGEDACPVCERPIGLEELERLVAARLAQAGEAVVSLAEQRERAEAAREAAIRDRKALADAERELSVRSAAVDALLAEAEGSLAALADELERAEAEEIERSLVASLRAASTRCAEGGPEHELATAFSELETACERALAAARSDVAGAASRARATHEDVSALEKLLDLLEADEALARLDASLASDELGEARSGLQGALHAAEVVKAVAEHVGEIALAEAKARTEAVAPLLEQWFSQLTAHDQLRAARLRVEVTRAGGRIRNAYRVRAASADGSWEAGPGPMLSGGYQTALAVAALCALADPAVRGHGLDLLVLDEPTQNLDPELTERLAEAIVRAAPARRTIVTTADGLFTQALERVAGGDAASVVRLGRWAEATGVTVLP